MIQILVAKLDSSRSFDWYDLSQKLNSSPAGAKVVGNGKGKGKSKKGEEGEGGLSGTELREVYMDVSC